MPLTADKREERAYNAVVMYGKTTPQLSKTRFLGGLQCIKQLCLAYYSPKLADPVNASQQATHQ